MKTEITYSDLQTRLLNNESFDMFNTVIVAEFPSEIWPEYKGKLRILDEDKKQRDSAILHAINCYGFLVPRNTIFRLNFLGELIKRYYRSDRSNLLADICLVNGVHYSPFIRSQDGSIEQI